MNWIKSSAVSGFLDKLDCPEKLVKKITSESIFIRSFQTVFNNIQDKFAVVSETSLFAKALDALMLILVSLALVAITFTSTGIIGLLIFLSSVLLLAKFCLVKGEKAEFTSFDVPIFLYMAIAGLSVCFSSLLLPSLKGYIKMLIYFGGYLTFMNIFKNNPKKVMYLMVVLTVTASLEAFYAVYQQVLGVEALASWQDESNTNPEDLMNRVYGTLKPFNPNLLAGYLIASFAPALGTAFYFLYKRAYRIAIPAFAGVMAILLAIVFTGCRGAYIAIAFMAVAFVLISGHIIWNEYSHKLWLKKLWKYFVILGIVGIIGLIAINPALQHRILSIFAFRADSSASYRMNVYASSIKMFYDNWLTGIGTGNTTFRLIYGLYMITGFDALGAYCVPLEVAIETGIFGLLAFSWLIILSLVKGAKYLTKDYLLENKIIVSACMIGIFGMMIHGLVDTVWYRPQINIIFWLLTAILAAVTSEKFNRKES